MRPRILVTGSSGQLGQCIQKIVDTYPDLELIFTTTATLDITNTDMIAEVFENGNFDFCINTAAYTDVEQAEKTPQQAYEVNTNGVLNVSKACAVYKVILIHISTDYVFDGEKKTPYTVNDIVNPINEYGKSKLEGEKYVQELLQQFYIIRTSWLYSEFGHNFYNTIVRKAKEEAILYITDEEIGCPTNANNLAKFMLDVLIKKAKPYGMYHFTDGEVMSWNEFAHKIIHGLGFKVRIESKNYPTFAKRPKYSVLLRNSL